MKFGLVVASGASVLLALLSACGEPATDVREPAVRNSLGDGTYTVGRDIQPGTYLTAGPAASGILCRATLTYGIDVNGAIAESITNNGDPRGTFEVVVRPNDKTFETTGCMPWIRQTAVPSPKPREVPFADTSKEDEFLREIRQRGVGSSDDERELRRGRSICTLYADGTARQQIVSALVANGFSATEAGTYIDVATDAFCAEYSE